MSHLPICKIKKHYCLHHTIRGSELDDVLQVLEFTLWHAIKIENDDDNDEDGYPEQLISSQCYDGTSGNEPTCQ